MTAIAVEGLTYMLSAPASETAPKSAQISPPASTKVKLDGKGVYKGTVNFMFPTGTISHPSFTASVTNTAPATFTISPSKITNTKAEGQTVLGEGDESSPAIVTGMMVAGLSTAPITASVTLKIQMAGQSKGKSN